MGAPGDDRMFRALKLVAECTRAPRTPPRALRTACCGASTVRTRTPTHKPTHHLPQPRHHKPQRRKARIESVVVDQRQDAGDGRGRGRRATHNRRAAFGGVTSSAV